METPTEKEMQVAIRPVISASLSPITSNTLEHEEIELSSPRIGLVYVEAVIGEGVHDRELIYRFQEDLEQRLSNCYETFVVGEDLLHDQSKLRLLMGREVYEAYHDIPMVLRITEYTGAVPETTCYAFNAVNVKVLVYKLHSATERDDELEHADVMYMPHGQFVNTWDNLIFEEDIKGSLLRMATNIVRFSEKAEGRQASMNPIILLHGLPGTGKSSLCQGLAQKISIRLSSTYSRTGLIQIRTAALLSKFYGESAKQVDKIFATIATMCEEDEQQFVCVMIDEVESIASSRESSMHGEAQDSLRATNALLTGLDKARKYRNIMFLCTSNMYSCLDPAFLDRCGLKKEVNPPTLPIRYEIMRGIINALIADGIINAKETLPCLRDARLESTTSGVSETYGTKLLHIINRFADSEFLSGRTLTQLPEQSILEYLEDGDDCSLDMALTFLGRSVTEILRANTHQPEHLNHGEAEETSSNKRKAEVENIPGHLAGIVEMLSKRLKRLEEDMAVA